MQDYVSETKAKAKQRSLGTLVGALAGLVYIMLEQAFGKQLHGLINIMSDN